MDPQGPRARTSGALRGSGTPGRIVLMAGGLVTLIVFMAYVLYSVQFSGSAQWSFGVVILGGLVALAVSIVLRRTARPVPFVPASEKRMIREGELTFLADTFDRAERGLGYSQELLVSRVREAIAERVRIVRGLSPEAMRNLESDAKTLERVVADEVLTDFLVGTMDRRARSAWVGASRKDELLESLHMLMRRTEAWR